MLNESVSHIKGVGEKTAKDLEAMNIKTVEDLLFYYPSGYNITEIKPLAECQHDETVTLVGTILYPPTVSFFGRKKSRLICTVEVEQAAVKIVMFNRPFAKNHLLPNKVFTFTGKWDAHRLQLTVQKYEEGSPANSSATIDPKYPLKGDMKPFRLKKMIETAVSDYSHHIQEILPSTYLQAYKLPSRQVAVRTMHQPESGYALKHARRRFTYEELLIFQIRMQLMRKEIRESTTGSAHQFNQSHLDAFVQSFPFTLTNAQQRVTEQILSDMKSPHRMNRLLQGDVGSGKTAVAAISLYATVLAGKQGALMVPTEILAEQHFLSLKELFADRISIALLTGSTKGKKREELLQAIHDQEIDLVIGTHALIQDDVYFHQLGLIVIDEQHRFGVNQRRTLREKGLYPDVLFMTATPIPRTLAITTFGDMDVSILDEMPAGRKPVETHWINEKLMPRLLGFMKEQIENGEQAYVICPLIEESETLDMQNAVHIYEQMKRYFEPDFRVGLMHGRLTVEEKDEIMQQYVENDIQVLVSTTVIEVGVNVPNATIMAIYNAERFGLSQLHQLRGRVGRGDVQSYCMLIADPKGKVGKERMRIMTETTDGFELSERDLELRGAGDFFGKKQSGVPEFKVADIVEDYRALETARQDAVKIVEENLLDKDPLYEPLRTYLEKNNPLEEKLD